MLTLRTPGRNQDRLLLRNSGQQHRVQGLRDLPTLDRYRLVRSDVRSPPLEHPFSAESAFVSVSRWMYRVKTKQDLEERAFLRENEGVAGAESLIRVARHDEEP